MSLSLAEFEIRCLHGPLDSITPADVSRAYGLVQRLAFQFHERMGQQAALWQAEKKPKRRRKSGIEQSLPVGDRA